MFSLPCQTQPASCSFSGIRGGQGQYACVAFGLSRLIASFLFGVKASDPPVFVTVPVTLTPAGSDTDRRSGAIGRITTIPSTTKRPRNTSNVAIVSMSVESQRQRTTDDDQQLQHASIVAGAGAKINGDEFWRASRWESPERA
jgi:hypothetical protein